MARGNVRVSITADADGVKRGTREAERALDRLKTTGSASIGGLATAAKAAGVVIAGGLVLETKRAIDEWREAEKVSRQTAAGIRSTGGAAKVTAKDVAELSESLSRKAGIDDEVIQSGANVLLTFTKIRNEVGQGNKIFDRANQAALDLSAKFDKDLSSSAIMVGKALNDPIKGVTALGRAGVQFDAQQRDQIKTLVESNRTLEAQKIILRELETQVGGAAAAEADGFDRLKVSVENLEEALGSGLGPAAESVADELDDIVVRATPAFERLGSQIEQIFDRDDLDLGEKLTLSSGAVQRTLRPFVRELGKELDDADIGEKLAGAVEKGAPVIADAAARAAPRAAGAFVNAFREAGPWGKLITVAFLTHRLGGFNAAGRFAADTMADAMRPRLARRFPRIFMTTATAAAGEAGTAGAEALVTGTSRGVNKQRGRLGKLGQGMGRTVGRGLGAGLVLALPLIIPDLERLLEEMEDWWRDHAPKWAGGDRPLNIPGRDPNLTGGGAGVFEDLFGFNPFGRRGGIAGPRGIHRFNAGGVVPARVSSGELLLDPDGNAAIVPGPRVAADNVLTALRPGTMVFTGDGQRRLGAGASLDDALRTQLPHFAEGGIVRGKVSTFGPPLERAGTTASGASSSEAGVAVRPGATFESGRATLGQRWLVSIRGHEAVLKQIDLGPHEHTGRRIDVTGAGARRLGFAPASFPTDAIGTARLVRRGGGGFSGDEVVETRGRLVPDLRPLSSGEINRRQLLRPLLDDAFGAGFNIGAEGGRRLDPLLEELLDAARIPFRRLPGRDIRSGRFTGDGTGGRVAGGALARGRARVIGTPYAGTHSLGNWQSDNALDIAFPFGTLLYAVNSGRIAKTGGSGSFGGRFGGYNFTLDGRNRDWFYAHMSRLNVRAGQTVRRGDLVGRSGKANGVDHLHIGVSAGDPRRLLGYRGGGIVGFFGEGGTAGAGGAGSGARGGRRLTRQRPGYYRKRYGDRYRGFYLWSTYGTGRGFRRSPGSGAWYRQLGEYFGVADPADIPDGIDQLEWRHKWNDGDRYQLGGIVGFQNGGTVSLGGLVGGLTNLGSGDNAGAARRLKQLADILDDAGRVTFGRIDRLVDIIRGEIRERFRGGLTSRERVQVQRLRAALTAAEGEMGRRTGELVRRAEQIGLAIAERREDFDRQLRAEGVDTNSAAGLGRQLAFLTGNGADDPGETGRLQAQRGELVAAKRRAQRAGNREAIRSIQDQINEVDDAIADAQATTAELQRAHASALQAEQRQARFDAVDVQLARAELTEGSDDDVAATGELIRLREQELAEAEASGDNAQIADAIRALKGAQDAMNALNQEAQRRAEEERERLRILDQLGKELKRQNDFAESVTAITGREAVRALADMISGEIVGRGIVPRQATAGFGSVASF